MKRKNGFTLIEVLGVIILLGILSVIVVPVVRDNIKKSKRKAYDKQVNTILTTTKEWAADNTDILANNSLFVKIETLKKSGLLENKKIINPVTNEEIQGCVKVSYNQEFNQYEYEYSDACIGYNDILSSDDECLKGEPNNCNLGTSVKVRVNDNESYNFYVIADDGNELTMIMDRNLGDNVVWHEMAYSAFGPLTAIAALKVRTEKWLNIEEREYVYSDEIGHYTDIVETMRARFLTYSESTSDEIGHAGQDGELPEFLYENLNETTQGYWTTATIERKLASLIYYAGSGWGKANSTYYGVRPVIIVPKFIPIY